MPKSPPEKVSSPKHGSGIDGLPARLDVLRQRAGPGKTEMSILAFARHCGVTNSAMHDYLSGRVLPGVTNLDGIAKANGVTLDWLVRGEGRWQDSDSDLLRRILRLSLEQVFESTALPADRARGLAAHLSKLVVSTYNKATTGGPDGAPSLGDVIRMTERAAHLGRYFRGPDPDDAPRR
jgi:transcriptional regulator with XRE-family HTH domain